MRLIYLAHARIPTEKAHGIGIMELCEAFSRERVEVELICPFRFNPIKKDPFEYYEIKRNFKIKKIPHLDLIPLGKFLGPFPTWFSSLLFGFSSFFYVLIKHRYRNDIFFSRNILPLLLTSFLYPNVFYEIHAFPNFKVPLQKFFYQLFLKRIRGVVVTNSRKKEELRKEFKISEDKILIAPNAVDLEKFKIEESQAECRKKLGLPQDKKIVLYTGHLYSWKGVDTLAQASQFLPENVEVYFVGGTKIDVKNFRIQNQPHGEQAAEFRIRITGHRPHSEIPYWLKTADVLVLPSTAKEDISKYWTSPIKLFEYMTSGRPIVATGVPSNLEILNEKNSILVNLDDPRALARGIIKALEEKQLIQKITTQALKEVKQYSWQNRARKILDFVFEHE